MRSGQVDGSQSDAFRSPPSRTRSPVVSFTTPSSSTGSSSSLAAGGSPVPMVTPPPPPVNAALKLSHDDKFYTCFACEKPSARVYGPWCTKCGEMIDVPACHDMVRRIVITFTSIYAHADRVARRDLEEVQEYRFQVASRVVSSSSCRCTGGEERSARCHLH
jgi:hypothetical protein